MADAHPMTAHPVRKPTHPGEILKLDILPALGMTITDAARHLGVTRQTLHRFMAGKTGITPELALRLGKFCGNGPGLWLRMQMACDVWDAECVLRSELDRIPTIRAS